MKAKNPKLTDVRKAMDGKRISEAQAAQLMGGWGVTKPYIRNPYPYILDTDRP